MPWLLTAAIRVYSRAGFVHKTASAALFCGSSMTSQLVGGRFLHTTPMPVLQQLALHSRSQRSLLTSCQAHNFERKVGGSAPLHNATPSIGMLQGCVCIHDVYDNNVYTPHMMPTPYTALGGGATSSSSSSTHPRPRPANRTRRPSNNTKGKSRPKRNSNNNNGVANDIISLTESSLMSSDDEETPELAKIMNAVVKVYCVHTEPNYSLPWQRKRQYSSTSSGFIISGNAGQRWILTNAHSVEYHSQVGVFLWVCSCGRVLVGVRMPSDVSCGVSYDLWQIASHVFSLSLTHPHIHYTHPPTPLHPHPPYHHHHRSRSSAVVTMRNLLQQY